MIVNNRVLNDIEIKTFISIKKSNAPLTAVRIAEIHKLNTKRVIRICKLLNELNLISKTKMQGVTKWKQTHYF